MTQEQFVTWLNSELDRRGWSRSEAARRGEFSSSTLDKIIGGFSRPGPIFCRGIARAFEVAEEEVFRKAGILPTRPAPRASDRRVAYQVDTSATTARLLELWAALTPGDQALLLELMAKLVRTVEPRIIGEAPNENP